MQQITMSDGEALLINGRRFVYDSDRVCEVYECRRCSKYTDLCKCGPLAIPEIKDLILKVCAPGVEVYPSDISMNYNLDYDDVIAAINDLSAEGRVK